MTTTESRQVRRARERAEAKAKARDKHQPPVVDIRTSEATMERLVQDLDDLVMLDVNIANAFSTKMGVPVKDPGMPTKSTEANIQLAIGDHKRNGLGGTDQQILLSAWGTILGQCMAAAEQRSQKFLTSNEFMAFIVQNVYNIINTTGLPIKTIRIHLHGVPNTTGFGGDPVICSYSADSKIELLDKAGKILERVDYKTLTQGKSDDELRANNADLMSKWAERTLATVN